MPNTNTTKATSTRGTRSRSAKPARVSGSNASTSSNTGNAAMTDGVTSTDMPLATGAEPVIASKGVSGETLEAADTTSKAKAARKEVTAPSEIERLTKKLQEGALPEGVSVRYVHRGGETRPVFRK